jgi:hypothetical protein
MSSNKHYKFNKPYKLNYIYADNFKILAKASFKNLEKIRFGENERASKISDFKIINNSADTTFNNLYIKDSVFVIDLYGLSPYFHLLSDILAQYLFLKKYIKDLKIVILDPKPENVLLEPPFKHNENILYEFLEKFPNDEVQTIKLEDYKTITIKHVYFYNHYYLYTLRGIRFKKRPLLDPSKTLPLLSNLLKNNIKEDKDIKIFISRKKENDRLRDLYEKNNKRHPSEWSGLVDYVEDPSGKWLIKRLISSQDEEIIEKFFKDLGYLVLDPSGYSLKEQIDMFARASHVAGLQGAGLINSIFCNPGSTVTILESSNMWGFDYNYIPDIFSHKFFVVPGIQKTENSYYTIKEIIDSLEKIKNQGFL